MRRACYCRKPNGYQILHLKAIRKDGYVETQPIKEFAERTFENLQSVLLEVNKLGYGVIGDIEDIKANNKHRIYVQKCGDNMMDIDEL